jgi:hypothetical protein
MTILLAFLLLVILYGVILWLSLRGRERPTGNVSLGAEYGRPDPADARYGCNREEWNAWGAEKYNQHIQRWEKAREE